MDAQTKRILVVDDDPDIRDVISLILSMEDYEVESLDNGREVVSKVYSFRPNIILLDMMLGDMDGIDICKSLKQNRDSHNIPVIIISATPGRHTMMEKNCGADEYLAKPFDIDELLSMVKHQSTKNSQQSLL